MSPRPGIRTGAVRLDDIDFHAHNVRVDLGDLRDLTDSIKRFGVLQPVVLEQRGQRLRIRAGHRRVAAARLAGLTRIPAMVHADALDDDEWLVAAVHENTRRRDLDHADRARTVKSMRDHGLDTAAIADAFGVSPATVRTWAPTGRPAYGGHATGGTENAERIAREDSIDPATGQRTPASVVAARTGTRTISASTVRTFAQEARVRVETGTWDTAQLLAAVDRLASTGRLGAALAAHDLAS